VRKHGIKVDMKHGFPKILRKGGELYATMSVDLEPSYGLTSCSQFIWYMFICCMSYSVLKEGMGNMWKEADVGYVPLKYQAFSELHSITTQHTILFIVTAMRTTTPTLTLSRFRGVTIRRGMDWMIGFINILYTPLRTTGNYSATANLHTLQFTVTPTSVLKLL
jgi:hypothetical protein